MRVKNLARTILAARRAAVRYTVAQRFPGNRKAIEQFLMTTASDAFIATFTRATREQRPVRVEMLLATAMGQQNTSDIAAKSPKPRRKLPPVAAPLPLRRVMPAPRDMHGDYVHLVEDVAYRGRCERLGRWLFELVVTPGYPQYRIPNAFVGSEAEARAKCDEWNTLVKSVRACDAAAHPVVEEDLPCVA